MTQLHIALQDGFFHDTVVVQVNGKEVFRKGDVKTRFQIGLAESFEVEVPSGDATVEVALPEKKRANSTIVKAGSQLMYLGVSLNERGEVTFLVSQEPFGYV